MGVKLSIRDSDGEIVEWWYDFSEALEDQHLARLSNICKIIDQELENYNAKLCPDFWQLQDHEYIEFDKEQDIVRFFLRWA